MFTHCRQFPHLAGMSDPEIRTLAQAGMLRRPGLMRLMRLRNAAVLVSMIIAIAAGVWFGYDLGVSMMLAGAVAFLLTLIRNVVWINVVMFRLTHDEISRHSQPPSSTESSTPPLGIGP